MTVKENAPQSATTNEEHPITCVNDNTDNDDSQYVTEKSFEQKVFERMDKKSQDFAKSVDWEALWVDYQEDLHSERVRAYTFITYKDSLNPDYMKIVTEAGLQGAVSPLHDSDRWPDGSLKKPHYHNLLYFPGKTSYAKASELASVLGGVMVQPVMNLTGMLRYFAHMDIRPDTVIADRGKVHYSPDDIVAFGGFDVEHHIRATKTQKTQALKELYKIVRENGITAYSDFIDLIYSKYHEYEYLLSDVHVCNQLGMYIRSRYAKAHMNDELKRMELDNQYKNEQIERLIGSLERSQENYEVLSRELFERVK